MRIRVLTSAPEKVKTRTLHELPMLNYPAFSRKKIIKDYVYTPEYRVIGL